MTREPADDAEREALARGREFLERTCWASLQGTAIRDLRHGVAVHLRGRDTEGRTVRVEVLVLRDGRIVGPRRITRHAHEVTGRRAHWASMRGGRAS